MMVSVIYYIKMKSAETREIITGCAPTLVNMAMSGDINYFIIPIEQTYLELHVRHTTKKID